MTKLPRFIAIPEVTHLTSLKKSAIYQLIKAREIAPIKLGRKTVFLESEIVEWVKRKAGRVVSVRDYP